MNGSEIALDTNEAIAVLNNTDDAGSWVCGFSTVYLPVPVVGELRFGALNSRRAGENLQHVAGLVQRCRILEIKLSTAELYADVRLHLKRHGKPIPENDIWIAALCIEHGLPLGTSDEHFVHVEGLEVIRR